MLKDRVKRSLRLLLRMDPIMLILMGLLMFVGCMFIYSSGQKSGGRFAVYWLKQIQWFVLGGGCFIGMVLVDYRKLGKWSWVLYLFSLVLLTLVVAVGKSENNAQSWLAIPGLPRIQPSEMAKPALLLMMAWLASRKIFRVEGRFVVPILVVVAIPGLLVCLQPDPGTAMVFMPMAVVVLFLAGIRWRLIIIAGVLGLLSILPVYSILKPHQKARIQTFINPAKADRDTAYNAYQSILAVGSGGLKGKGFMYGDQHILGFLPRTVAPTDFIFSVIAEESGFMGSAAVVLAFIGFILCCLRTSAMAADDFGAYLAAGVAVMFFTHIYINIGMTILVAPIIGIPLPFVSYGGSFVISAMITAGMVQSVHVRRTVIDK